MRRGFTLTDVLVTMAVMAVLLSLLLPSLKTVRETARQVVCRSNVHQLGLGLYQYAESNSDRIPPTIYVDEFSSANPWRTMTLHMQNGGWDGIGHLYQDEYMPAPKIFYCPSHHGNYPYLNYEDCWGGQQGEIVGNFQYRWKGPSASDPPGGPVHKTEFLSAMRPGTALLVDGFRTQSDFNHETGANVFRADNSVSWFSDTGGVLMSQIPKTNGDNASFAPLILLDEIWSELDNGPR